MAYNKEELWRTAKSYTNTICTYGKASQHHDSDADGADALPSHETLQHNAFPLPFVGVEMTPFTHGQLSSGNSFVDYACLQPVVHYGFIPVIIVLGMTVTEPRPAISQLLSPV